MEAIYRMRFDCGRQGELTGIFVAEKAKVKVLLENGIEIYWGEVLGKHSEVYGPLDEGELIEVSDNPDAIKIIKQLKLESGYNPFHYSSFNFEHDEIDAEDMGIDELCDKLIELQK